MPAFLSSLPPPSYAAHLCGRGGDDKSTQEWHDVQVQVQVGRWAFAIKANRPDDVPRRNKKGKAPIMVAGVSRERGLSVLGLTRHS